MQQYFLITLSTLIYTFLIFISLMQYIFLRHEKPNEALKLSNNGNSEPISAI